VKIFKGAMASSQRRERERDRKQKFRVKKMRGQGGKEE